MYWSGHFAWVEKSRFFANFRRPVLFKVAKLDIFIVYRGSGYFALSYSIVYNWNQGLLESDLETVCPNALVHTMKYLGSDVTSKSFTKCVSNHFSRNANILDFVSFSS